MKKLTSILIALIFIWASNQVLAQDESQVSARDTTQEQSDFELSGKAANPLANWISIPFQYNLNFGVGQYNRSSSVLNIMPAIPYNLFGWTVMNRIIVPFMSLPDTSESSTAYGIGNINYSMLFIPTLDGIFQIGFGPAFNIPTSTSNKMGPSTFGIGPSLVFLVATPHLTAGVTANQLWSYNKDVTPFSQLFIQYFITYNIKKGWYINTNPFLTANWELPEGNQWVVPVGAGVGKSFKIGEQPMRFQVQYYNNVVAPPGGADWSLMILFALMFEHN
jgi:hypothetical protein